MKITKKDIGRFVEDGYGTIEQIAYVYEDQVFTMGPEDACLIEYDLKGRIFIYPRDSKEDLTKFRDDVQTNLDLLILHGISMGLL